MSGHNKYGSILRTYLARNIYEDALAAPADITFPAGNVTEVRTIPNFSFDVNKDTNFSVQRVGVFSNFADGLVFKDAADRLDVSFLFAAYRFMEDYTIDVTYGSKSIAATGTTGWSGGSASFVAAEIETDKHVVVIVDAADVSSGVLRDYWQWQTDAALPARTLQLVGNDALYTFRGISTLNCMYNVNEFGEPFQFSATSEYDIIVVRVVVNEFPRHSTKFLTKSINTSFNDDAVYFDVVADIEFTGKSS